MGGRVPRSRALLAALTGLLCVLLPTAPAYAHNALTSSAPANGARIGKAPERVRLTFLAKLDPQATKITITGPDNIPATGGAPTFAGTRVDVPFKPGRAGLYILEYRVPSDDGHRGRGEIRFTLTAGVTPTTSPTGAAVPAITASPSATAGRPLTSADDDGPDWWPWAAGALFLAVVGGAVLLVRRRLYRPPPSVH